MSICKHAILFSALAVVLAASPALGQREIQHVPPFVDPDGYNPDVYHPFVEPNIFNPDFQFFAPAQFGEFGGGQEENTGWFATYDRIYMWMTRPEDQVVTGSPSPASPNQPNFADEKAGDFTYGNRYDVGYMTSEDHGWLVSFWHIDGPNFFDRLEIERINVFEPLDEVNNDPTTVIDIRGGGATGGNINPGRQGRPSRDQNDPVTRQRDFRIENSVNMADLSSFELNKTFRFNPLHYGSVVEPFVGFRYIKFSDFYQRDQYEVIDPTTGARLGTGIPMPPQGLGGFTVEEMTQIRGRFDNHMVGGQLGLRWYKRKQKWNLAGEVRAFALQNFQSLDVSTNLERTFYGATGLGQAGDVGLFQERFGDHASEFVIGTEIRVEAAYAITRDIRIRGGMAFMELGRGIGRGNNIARNDQDVTIVGATFGVTVNR